MAKKNTIFILTLIFLSIIFILGFALYRCMLVNKRLKAEMPSLTVGEKINYLTSTVWMRIKSISSPSGTVSHP